MTFVDRILFPNPDFEYEKNIQFDELNKFKMIIQLNYFNIYLFYLLNKSNRITQNEAQQIISSCSCFTLMKNQVKYLSGKY